MRNKDIRVRFAPSPTGEIHIGSVRTALFNFLFAKHHKGKIVLRIEDTDVKRFVKGATERLIKGLKWLGIEFDESPEKGGKFKPYVQSERLGLYQQFAQQLVENGHAYYCFCTEERLKKLRDEQEKKKQAPMYDRTCLSLLHGAIVSLLKKKTPYVIRMKIPYSSSTEFDDLIRGHISINNSTIDDQILIKSDGMPTYHLANVVDDHLMEISHVLRAEEWLPSTPKHIILYQAFGWEMPEFGHVSLILAPDRSKLSKRHGTTSVEEFIKAGYLPEAIVNYLVLLGWNPKSEREFFVLNELVKEFDISKVNKAGAIFDKEKLNYFNAHYLHNISNKEIAKRLLDFNPKLKKIEKSFLEKIIEVEKTRMVTLADFPSLDSYFFIERKTNKDMLVFKKSTLENTRMGLSLIANRLSSITESDWQSIEKLNTVLSETVKKGKLSNGDIFWPVRVALSGQEKSPSPAELLWVLGKDESLKRIKNSIKELV
ncbi:glutamate--tRNA ligase [Candidatus Berkelbacteria bacterium RIFCSPHIGHO2_12_FULL_36_9]|uniref:Glutamate--tRNA ligase n=1 Tax=Candidatus Berkelbacteria bacterium RIFCSPHIGHO2_12_FULL_36_9 TaxID=1797469 RepID=A0A1F5EI94_9BACT|nr:MAG: glutamate--tRNA ligase [Candidatus Berkelbacteria bacterium RIFCSPHIGHO2_12_FULL_36_9]